MSTLSEINKTKEYLSETYTAFENAGAEIPEQKNMKNLVATFNTISTGETSAKITDASYLFYNGARMDFMNEILSLCENVTDIGSMFYGLKNISTLNLNKLDTSNVTNMNGVFNQATGLTSLDVSGFNTSSVTNMSNMFSSCNKLGSLDLSNFNTNNVTNMNNMFSSCSSLTSINVSNFDTSNVTNMGNMFYFCNKLTDLDLSSFDMSKVTNVGGMVKTMTELTNLKSFKNLGKGYVTKTQNSSSYKLDLSNSNKLTHESIIDIINNLYDLNLTYDVANGGTLYRQSLVLGSTNLEKLTEEEIAIATNKGWDVT